MWQRTIHRSIPFVTRPILRSILVQDDTLLLDKAERWYALIQNYIAWKPYLDEFNLLVVRYEDLVTAPAKTMEVVYSHLDLPFSPRFMEPFPRLFPQRFLWETSVASESGVRRDFDLTRINAWQRGLTDEQLGLVYSNATLVEFMERFGYQK